MRPLVWLFDLDNTLHDARHVILPRVNADMTRYVANRLNVDPAYADQLRRTFWHRYGATLSGMMKHHRVNPHEFLLETHRFPDMDALVAFRPQLTQLLRRLPGRKVLFTNAPRFYALAVLKAAGLNTLFKQVVSIEDMQFAGHWQPKPSVPNFRRIAAQLRVSPARVCLIEDTPVNLHGAKKAGIPGVWVRGMSSDKRGKPLQAGLSRKVSVQVQSVRQLKRLVFS